MTGALRRLWGRLLREHSTPTRLAAAAAVGVLIGCSPFYGLHFWIGVTLSVALRLNKLAVFFGTQTIIPPAVPLVIFCDVQAGAFMRRGAFLTLSPRDLAADPPAAAGALFLDWLAGWPLVGGAAALVAFAVVLLLLRLGQRRRTRGLA